MPESCDEQNNMHRRIEWMTRADVTILEFLHVARDVKGRPSIQTPKTVALNTGHQRKYCGNRLRHLDDHGLVERVDRGQYRMSTRGEQLMKGQLSATDL